MKTPVNNITVYNFEPQDMVTSYPVQVTDEEGNVDILHRQIPDSDLSNVMCSDVSLNSLLKAGVDPSKMRVNTSQTSRIDTVTNALEGLSDLDASLFSKVSPIEVPTSDNK